MTSIEFVQWLDTAKRGDTTVYHTGYLANDRMNNSEVITKAKLVHQAYEDGQVILTQRTLIPGHVYEYLATRKVR